MDTYNKGRKNKRRWRTVVSCLAAVTVFCTVYALILPAITSGQDDTALCGCVEHTHTDACYADGVLSCELTEHLHSSACFDVPSTTVEEYLCGLEEHTHNADCYFDDGVLKCTLTEHLHSDACLSAVVPAKEIPVPEEESVLSAEPKEESVLSAEPEEEMLLSEEILHEAMPAEAKAAIIYTDPLDVADYVPANGARLYYRVNSSDEWTEVVSGVTMPANAALKLEISYKDVNIDTLTAANRQMTYTLPPVLRHPTVSGTINAGRDTAGTITASDDTIALSFDEAWLAAQRYDEHSKISGKFYVYSELNLAEIDPRDPTLRVGSVEITIQLDDDLIARYGEISITKKNSTKPQYDSAENRYYLTYTLTVTAGEDGAVDVTVIDNFNTASRSYIASYDLPSDAKLVTKNGNRHIEWTIGNMSPNETKRLSYKAYLADSFFAGTTLPTLTNTAKVYEKTYERGTDTSTFTPRGGATVTKSKPVLTQNGDGSAYYTYTVTVKANDNNTHTLENVKVIDTLVHAYYSKNDASHSLLKWLSYDQSSVKVQGEAAAADFDSNSFTVDVGALEPGQSKTVTYRVKVAKDLFLDIGNNDAKIKNTANACSGDTSNLLTTGSSVETTLSHKKWDRKLAGTKLTNAQEIAVSGSMYDATGSTVQRIENATETQFTAPAGSYKYSVLANESGDWNISSASMTDQFSGIYMEYVGYVRVNAYKIDSSAPICNLTDSDSNAVNKFNNKTPTATVWVKVDGKTGFSFTPEDIGLAGQYAYLLTYYAKPVNTQNVSKVDVTNTFELGTIQGDTIERTGLKVSAKVTIQGSSNLTANKGAWYYANYQEIRSLEGVSDWFPEADSTLRGALYWYIKIDGDTVPAGTQVEDVITKGTNYYSYFRNQSLVGVYTGKLSIANYRYPDLAGLVSSGRLTALEESAYSMSVTSNLNATFTLNQAVTLQDGDSLYILLRTDPQTMYTANASGTYKNKMRIKMPEGAWSPYQEVSQIAAQESYVVKTGYAATYDGTNLTANANSLFTKAIAQAEQCQPGTYAAWLLNLNPHHMISGKIRVIDTVPEGMALEFATLVKYSAKYSASNAPRLVQIAPENLPDGGAGWTEHVSASRYKSTDPYAYYYTRGSQVLFDVEGLTSHASEDRSATVLVVTRVTDENVLMKGAEKEFQNKANVYQDGEQVGSHSATVKINKKTVSKSRLEADGSTLPFKIELNPLGERLLPGSTSGLTLVDEMSASLTFVPSSLQVKNTATGEQITGWTSSISTGKDGRTTLTIGGLPDETPLTVTYTSTVNVLPNQTVRIENYAYWQGYQADLPGWSEDYSYSVGGTVGSDTPPSVTVTKYDLDNTSKLLDGAAFALQEVTYENGEFTPTGTVWTGTTAGGVLTFNTGDKLKSNTIYRLTETAAPSGYALDSAPHYFVVAKQDENGEYPDFLKSLPDCVDIHAWENSPQYFYTAYNQLLTYTLPETGGEGTLYCICSGLGLMAASVLCGCRRKRRECI